MIVIVDYGMSNLRSVERAIVAVGGKARVISDPNELEMGRAIVLPGDGAFGQTMDNLRTDGWIAPLLEAIDRGLPFLGICLGMQLLFETSEEMGEHKGLGVLRGSVRKFPSGKIPQIGWNQLRTRRCSGMLRGVADGSYAYFVHSYFCQAQDPEIVAATTEYGIEYPSVVEKGNLWGAQFHPEKSGTEGLKVLRNFVRAHDDSPGN